jgi:hypothetical protein
VVAPNSFPAPAIGPSFPFAAQAGSAAVSAGGGCDDGDRADDADIGRGPVAPQRTHGRVRTAGRCARVRGSLARRSADTAREGTKRRRGDILAVRPQDLQNLATYNRMRRAAAGVSHHTLL